MEKKEALLIAEEILKIIILDKCRFAKSMHEYICYKIDISDQSLEDVLHIISEMKDNDEKKRIDGEI